jgi:hypothetical protein
MTDTTGHRLLIVAPSDWFGNEVVPITVKDPKGNADTEALTVQVQQAELPKPPDPPPPDTCGIVELSVDTGSASLVLVAGTFNDWATTPEKAIKLFDPDGDGVFATTLVLEPGAYQYKFIVDGAWKEDPTNPETAPDGYGGVNSVLVVPPCD